MPLTRLFAAPLRICVARQPDELLSLFAEIERGRRIRPLCRRILQLRVRSLLEPSVVLSARLPDHSDSQPLAWFGIYTQPHLFDHQTGAFLHGESPALAQSPPARQAPGGFAVTGCYGMVVAADGAVGAALEVHQQVAGLLGRPRAGRVGRDAG